MTDPILMTPFSHILTFSNSQILTRKLALNNLPQRHIDDILISLEAYVNGGIGPQKSYQSHAISRNQYK